MTYCIEKNIPRPTKGYGKYPFSQMEIGDSFIVPIFKTAKGYAQLCRAAYNHGYFNRKKFSVRTIKGEGHRVWRIK